MSDQVRVTRHALARARERNSGAFTGVHAVDCRVIAGEVGDAIAAGRMACRLPRWAVRPGCSTRTHAVHQRKRGGPVEKSSRFVWTADRTRVYVVRRSPNITLVVTAIAVAAASEAA